MARLPVFITCMGCNSIVYFSATLTCTLAIFLSDYRASRAGPQVYHSGQGQDKRAPEAQPHPPARP
jgi:hypothetical protein